ncbi:MAG: PAS domain S-box protein, partial [Chitinophagaceae bacterium]
QKFEELLMNVLATGRSHKEFETPALVNTPDGDQLYYLDFEYAPLFETDGTVSGIMAQVYNVTEKVAARLKSKEAAERLELVLNASELGTWELSLPGNEFTFSKKFLEIFHFEEDQQPTHEEVLKRIHPGDLAARAAAFESAYASGTLIYNCRLLTGEEQVRWIEVKGKVFYDDQQQPVKVIGTIRDFTEERKAQQRITESELRFRTVADTAPVMIWMSTSDKARSFFNKAWLMFRGRTSREEAGMAWMEAIHPDDAPHCLEIYTKNFDARKEYHMEYRLLRYDGEYRWISENGVPRFGADGSFEGYIGASKDIHDRIVFEEKIQESETRLRIAALSGELGTWDYSPIT